MSPFFCPLASGSKGNALLVRSSNSVILIDAGISCKQLQERLKAFHLHLSDIDAILVTHEHVDHIAHIGSLSLKHKIPILTNAETAKAIYDFLGSCPQFKIFSTGESFCFGDLQIYPFTIQHDAVEPIALTIEMPSARLGICTDLGSVTTLVKMSLKECSHLYIEANHEPDLVKACSRPRIYQDRVLGPLGHLSNEQSAELLKHIATPYLKKVYLAHLSSECNTETLALRYAQNALQELQLNASVEIAYQDRSSTPSLLS